MGTIDLHAAVVMPDHVHLLFSALDDAAGEPYSIPEIMQAIKGASAHRINRLMSKTGPVWQAESFDRVPRSWEKFSGMIEYVRLNPVAARLVEHPDEYRWTWEKPS